MLNKIEVSKGTPDLLTLPISDPFSDFVVMGVEGLDPGKATLVTSAFALMDGIQFQSARREGRNIVLTIGLVPDYVNDTPETLRGYLYNMFIPKTLVNLRFYRVGGLVVNIRGMVESCETSLFTKDPQVVASVMCFDPDFIDSVEVDINDDSVSDSTEFTIDYAGTVPAGFGFRFLPNRTVSEFTIYQRPEDGVTRTFDFQYAMLADDVINISTVRGSKNATLTRTGVDSSVIQGVSPSSTWLELMPGANHMRIFAAGAPIPYFMYYSPRYGGL